MSKISINLRVFLLLLTIQIGFGVWRYKNILEEDKLFTSKNAIFLEYEGSSFVQWQYPSTCDVNNKSSPNAILKCKSPGFHSVKPLVSASVEEEERYLHISNSIFSFTWYAVMPTDRNVTADSQVVRLWIIDPDQADQAEINKTALVPSRQSRYVSKHFFNMGQYPVIQLSSPTQSIQGYFTKEGYWEALLPGNPIYRNFHVHGQPISFQNRFVISSQHTFYWAAPEDPYDVTAVPLRLPTGSQLSLVWRTCASYHALLLSDRGVFLTRNAFRTYEEVKVAPGTLPVPPEGHFTVDEAALLEDGIIFRVGDALLWRDDRDGVLSNRTELPVSGIRGLHVRTSCVDYYPVQNYELATVIVWTDFKMYVGSKRLNKQDGGSYLLMVLELPPYVRILTASFGSHPASMAALVLYNYRPVLVTSSELAGLWKTSTFLTKFQEQDVPAGPLRMRFLSSALDALLVWNQDTMLYSFRNNIEWGDLRPLNASNLSQAANGSKIHQVAMDHSWNMLVKMENNVLFYCKLGMRELVRLHAWTVAGSHTILYVNQKERIAMVTVSPTGRLHVQTYPMLMETWSAMRGSHHDCPFITFSHSMTTPAYYLDKGDRVTLWAQLVYPEGKGVHVTLLNNREHLLRIAAEIHFESVHRVDTVNETLTIQQQVDYRDAPSYSDLIQQTSGVVTLELLPSQIGNTCNLPRNRISHFHVGCPPNRHIRVARPWGMPCETHSFENYTIPGSVLRNPQKEDLSVDYDWEKFGCVLRMHYKTAFHPGLDLYDGDQFVRSVDANFIVWEKFGRNDYSFNATMRQVSCLREAQTWKAMLTGGKRLEEAWGPENYRSCFMLVPGLLGNLDQPYEIMNRSSTNYLTFSQVDSATYIFNVKILDPNYSFCDLNAVFVVQTYGIKIPKYQHLTTPVAVTFTLVSLCILGFSYCRYVTIFQKLLSDRQQKYD